MKLHGTPYLSLADECDAEIAARYCAQGKTRSSQPPPGGPVVVP